MAAINGSVLTASPPVLIGYDLYGKAIFANALVYSYYPYFIISCLFDDLEFKLGG